MTIKPFGLRFATVLMSAIASASNASHFVVVKKDDMVELTCPKPKTTLKFNIDCPRIGGSYHIVHKDGKQGIMNRAGVLTAATVYDEISLYDDVIAKVRLGKKWGLVRLDTGVELTPIAFDDMGLLHEQRIPVKQGGKAGHIDIHGNITTPIIYGDSYRFKQGLAMVTNDGNVRDDTYRVGLVDLDGQERFAPIYRHLSISHDGQQVVFETVDRVSGAADPSGKVLVAPAYVDLGFFHHGYASMGLFFDDLHGYIDTTGVEVIEPQYHRALTPQMLGDKPIFIVAKQINRQTKWGAIDAHHQVVIDFIYDRLAGVYDDMLVAERDGKATIIGAQGKELFAPRYRTIAAFGADTSYYQSYSDEHGRAFYGIIDKSGKERTPAIYDDISLMLSNDDTPRPVAWQVKYQGRFGVLDLAGRPLIAPVYDEIRDANNGNLYPQQGGRYAIYDKATGSRIKPPSYSHIHPLMEGYTKVKRPNEHVWYLLDKQGKSLGRTSAPMWYKDEPPKTPPLGKKLNRD